MKKSLIPILAIAGLAAISPGLSAATLAIPVDIAGGDFLLMEPGSTETRSATQDSSAGWNSGTARSTIFAFDLPSSTDSITSVDFTTYYRQMRDTDSSSADLTLTDVSLFVKINNGSVPTTDFIAPADFSSAPSGWTTIQLDFLDGSTAGAGSNTAPPAYSLSSAGNTALTSFLNDFYTNTGYTSGDQLLVSLALDLNTQTPNGNANFKFDFYPTSNGNSGTGTATSLSIVSIPEPGSAVLVGAGLGCLLLGRRRRRTA